MSPNIVATAKGNRSIVSVVRFTIILVPDSSARVYFDWFAAAGGGNERYTVLRRGEVILGVKKNEAGSGLRGKYPAPFRMTKH
jgi:hypothetical protein